VYDLMEPLRTQVDRLVLSFIRSHSFAPSDFTLGPGLAPEDAERMIDGLRVACDRLSQRAVAKTVRMSLRDVSALVLGKRRPTPQMLKKLNRALPCLE
jgi:CRISPR/Cas system-associated endonuclease Cas1